MNNERYAEQPKRRRINWDNPEDVRAVVIASMGFSDKCVQDYTHLSPGQIRYRMKLANLGTARREFRNGTSWVAKQFIRTQSKIVETKVEKQVHKPHQTNKALQPPR